MWPSSLTRGVLYSLLFSGISQGAPTCNTPSNRACWASGFNINTDYEVNIPSTGVTRSYTLTVTEIDNWVGPDGRVKIKAMLINGKFPGPTIEADWGDTIKVTVINQLRVNGTSFHWHGIRMLRNAINDGANGVTECPIPPGSRKTYTFRAEQYGTSWYHSHFGSQYANGVVGTMKINGPASLPYDIDLGVFPITDWYLGAADQIQLLVDDPNGRAGAPPPADNMLFNGTNINPAGPGGAYSKVSLTPGKRHLLRIINTSVETNFVVSLVGHQFTVISNDFVPVQSFTTNSIYLAIGQRYDVTIDASQAVDNYWFNVTFSNTGLCGSSSNPKPAAIFSYKNAPNALPTNRGTVPPDSLCDDTPRHTPVLTRSAPIAAFSPTSQNLPVSFVVDTSATMVEWRVNGSAVNVQWDKPTLQYVLEGNTSYPRNANVVPVPGGNLWSYWLIQNESPVPHPMHLHGHDFLKLGSSPALANPFAAGPRPFNPSTDTALLQTNNPVRRDVTMLPGFGWLVVAFKTDNAGAWLFHCHIAWHVSQGLSVQFLENRGGIASSQDLNSITPNCNAWRTFYANSPFKQHGSGL